MVLAGGQGLMQRRRLESSLKTMVGRVLGSVSPIGYIFWSFTADFSPILTAC